MQTTSTTAGTTAGGSESGYLHDVAGETRQDRSDNVTGNWTQVKSIRNLNTVII